MTLHTVPGQRGDNTMTKTPTKGKSAKFTKRSGRPISRRKFLAGSAAVGGAALAAPLAAPWIRRARAAEDEITIFTWETYHEPSWVKKYEESRGVKVNVVETGSVDEMYAKTRSGALESDLIFIDSGSIARYVKAGLLVPFDASKVPNSKNVGISGWEQSNLVNGELYGGIPYNWGTQPLMYRTDKVVPEPTSWGVLWDSKYKGKVTLPDDAYITVPMIALYAGAKDPFNMTDSEFESVRQALADLRPQIKTITKGFDDATSVYGAGDAVVGYCQNIAVVTDLNTAGLPFVYSFPDEGTPSWVDNFCVTERGNRDIVYDFCNFCLTPEWQAEFIQFSANNGILSSKVARESGIPDDFLNKTNILDQDQDGFFDKLVFFQPPEDFDRRLAIWNEFKAGA